MKRHLTRNAARCLACDEIVESRHRHDFVSCGCGAIAVDGGLEYLKRSGRLEHVHDLSEYAEGPRPPLPPEVIAKRREKLLLAVLLHEEKHGTAWGKPWNGGDDDD